MRKAILAMSVAVLMAVAIVITLTGCRGQIEQFTITFNTLGGSIVPYQTILSGATATQPTDPARGGYAFVDWTTEKNGGQMFNFNAPITADITVYALWHQATKITVENGTVNGVESGEFKVGTTVTIEATTGLDFFYFSDVTHNNVLQWRHQGTSMEFLVTENPVTIRAVHLENIRGFGVVAVTDSTRLDHLWNQPPVLQSQLPNFHGMIRPSPSVTTVLGSASGLTFNSIQNRSEATVALPGGTLTQPFVIIYIPEFGMNKFFLLSLVAHQIPHIYSAPILSLSITAIGSTPGFLLSQVRS